MNIKCLKGFLLIFCCTIFFNNLVQGQSFWFGSKVGPGLNFQSWGSGNNTTGINRDVAFSFNGDIFIESYDQLGRGSMYAALGYHSRGSAVRFFSFNNDVLNQTYRFNNVVLEVGFKKAAARIKSLETYFLLGVRGEYTVSNNLGSFNQAGNLFFPSKEFVRNINYGVTAGGGFEFYLSPMSNGFVEFSIHPDISIQYEQPPIANVMDPFGNRVNLPLTQVRNLSMELKFGIKFLRKVEYID